MDRKDMLAELKCDTCGTVALFESFEETATTIAGHARKDGTLCGRFRLVRWVQVPTGLEAGLPIPEDDDVEITFGPGPRDVSISPKRRDP